MTAADVVLDASAALTRLRAARHPHGRRCTYVALAEALDEPLRIGDQPLARAVARHTGVVVALFDCDRAWLLHPCDPDADVHRVCMERARPGHAGAFGRAVEIASDPELAAVIRTVLDSSHPVRFDPKSARALRPAATERYGIRSMLAAAVYPKMDAPYLFGLDQCSHARVWTPAEERLFQAIGRRLADALDRLSMFRDLRESERKLERSRAELTASRARVLAAGDDARRRIQRDLHDGAQQRLVQTVVTLKLARRALGDAPSPAVDLVEEALSHAARANGELRELAHGILPAALVNGGLRERDPDGRDGT